MLRQVSENLTASEPLRSRLILEMAADLDALTDHFRKAGLPEREAMAEAEKRLLVDAGTMDELLRVHTTALERGAIRVAWSVRSGFDTLLFLAGVSPLLFAAIWAASGTGLEMDGVGWLIVFLGGIGSALSVRVEWKLRRREDLLLAGRGLGDLLYLGVFTLMAGSTAFLFRTIGIFGQLSTGTSPGIEWVGPLISATSVFALALIVGIGCALSWFVLIHRLAVRQQAESRRLLAC